MNKRGDKTGQNQNDSPEIQDGRGCGGLGLGFLSDIEKDWIKWQPWDSRWGVVLSAIPSLLVGHTKTREKNVYFSDKGLKTVDRKQNNGLLM